MTDPLESFYQTIPEPPRPRRRGHILTLLVVAVLAAAAGAGTVIALRGGPGPGTAAAPAPATSPGTSPGARHPASAATPSPAATTPRTTVSGIPVPPTGAAPAAASGKLDPQTVTNMVQPSMVDISAPQAYRRSLSEGTGIILTSNGLVLTNNHVIEGATEPTATVVSSGKTYKARIIGYDSAADVSLLRLVRASGLPPPTL